MTGCLLYSLIIVVVTNVFTPSNW